MNGLIEQWASVNTTQQHNTVNFNIVFSKNPTIECVGVTSSAEGATRHVFSIHSIDTTKFSVYINYGLLTGFDWTAKGY